MRKHIPAYARRVCVYGLGLILLALGLTLNVKARLGAAPVLTVPLTISEIWNVEYSKDRLAAAYSPSTLTWRRGSAPTGGPTL